MQCCVLPQEDDDNTRNKDLKDYNYNHAASSDEGSGSPMDWGYDETAETESTPRYEEQGSEVEKIRFPVQDMGLVDNNGVGGSLGVQG